MPLPLPYSQVNLGANTSSQTGNPFYVGDLRQITVSVTTGAAAASRISIIGSNADGLQSTLSSANPTVATNLWSHITQLLVPGIFTIDPGFRWVNAIRATSESGQTASNVTVIFAGRT